MNRIVSAVLALVILVLAIETLDASKAESPLNNGKKQVVKRRSKRNLPLLAQATSYDSSSGDPFTYGTSQSGLQLQNTINYVQQRKLFVSGLTSLSALQNGGMCVPNTNYFTSDAFSALSYGHLTLPQLSPLNLFPIPSVDVDGLLNAAYIVRFGQSNILTGLGVLANMFGHILPSQLRPMNLYPLPTEMHTSSFLQQAGYLHSDCLPTALGLAASYIRYIPNNFASSGCQLNEDYPMSVDRLVSAKYVHGVSKIVTSVGIAAILSGYINRDVFQNFGCYPFVTSAAQTQTSQYVYQEQSVQTIVSDLTDTGYLFSNGLLSYVAYYAISKSYFSIENFRSLNLWPCPNTITMSAFIAAGYGSYSGHLTTLGTYLYQAQYFPANLLQRLGIHSYGDSHFYQHVLSYGGYVASAYHETHSAIHSALSYPSLGLPGAQVAQYQAAGSSVQAFGGYPSVAGTSFTGGDFGGESAFSKK